MSQATLIVHHREWKRMSKKTRAAMAEMAQAVVNAFGPKQPRRIRLSRQKGFDLQRESMRINGLPAVNCARPTVYGNPYVVTGSVTLVESIRLHRSYAKMMPKDWFAPLRGKNLACWCPLNQPCHCDTLLELANQ